MISTSCRMILVSKKWTTLWDSLTVSCVKIQPPQAQRNKKSSKVRYIVEQYFGINHLHYGAQKTRFTTIAKNKMDCWSSQATFNRKWWLKILR